jgi:hypothetical protein
MALVFVLPVPLLAATGLSLPLPAAAYRIGVAAVERTAAIAQAVPGGDSAPPAPPRIVTASPKTRAATSGVTRHDDRSVGTRTRASSARSDSHGTVGRHERPRRKVVVRSHFSSGSKAWGKRTSHPVAVPEAPTSSTAANATTAPVSTPAPAAPRATTTPATGTSQSGGPTGSDTQKTDDAAKAGKVAKEQAKDAKAAEQQAARDAKAAQEEAEQAAKTAQQQALKDAKAAAEQATKDTKAAKDKSAG